MIAPRNWSVKWKSKSEAAAAGIAIQLLDGKSVWIVGGTRSACLKIKKQALFIFRLAGGDPVEAETRIALKYLKDDTDELLH